MKEFQKVLTQDLTSLALAGVNARPDPVPPIISSDVQVGNSNFLGQIVLT